MLYLTIGVVTMHERMTAKNLREKITGILSRYDVTTTPQPQCFR